MNEPKKTYVSPVITEVRFEDKNLVTFGTCAKSGNLTGNPTSDCCSQSPEQTPNDGFDPS